jgi:hypothetical protein
MKLYFKNDYSAYHGVADLYTYFFEQGIQLLTTAGRFGFITSNKFMRSDYGTTLRRFITEETHVIRIVDFGELPVFEEVSTFPAILIAERSNSNSELTTMVSKIKNLNFNDLSQRVDTVEYPTTDLSAGVNSWSLTSVRKSELIDKVESAGVPLEEYVNGGIYWGIKTGKNEAFFIDKSTRDELVHSDRASREVIKPLIVGDDVRKYRIRNQDQYLIFTRHGTDIDQYPAIKEYLGQFREELRPRPKDHSGPWQGRKAGDYQWYEIQDAVEFWKLYEKQKIVYPEIAKEPRFAFDDNGYYANNKCFIIPKSDFYLLTLLNSTLLFEVTKSRVSVLGDEEAGGRLELRSTHLRSLPIYNIHINPNPKNKKKVEKYCNRFIHQDDIGKIDVVEFLFDSEHANDETVRKLLENLGREISTLHRNRHSLNLSLLDHLGTYDEGPTLTEIGFAQPPAGITESILSETSEEKANLRIGRAAVEREGPKTVEIRLSARYKPEDEEYETDRWGYTETELLPALGITDLTEREADLVSVFVPYAVKEAGGFAGFRETATKTNSLVDRLERLTLPAPGDVESGLERYLETKERAEELDRKIEKTDELIDQIVYELYGLTEEEIEIVEEAVSG